MNKTFTITIVIIGTLVMSAMLFGAGVFIGRASFGNSGFGSTGRPLMFSNRLGMGNDNNPGYSMMGGGFVMMNGYPSRNNTNVAPLSIEDAKQTVGNYLKELNNADLELKEIMIFDNNGYARITEKSSGIGAMELLIDPASLAVYPEYGPNMMWNLKYGHMNGIGGMMGDRRGMMGGFSTNPGKESDSMSITPDKASEIAQKYLDQEFPGYQAAQDADPFYGYYTIDILKDGNPTGMLSVNGFSGQVFLHTWHGTFIEMFE